MRKTHNGQSPDAAGTFDHASELTKARSKSDRREDPCLFVFLAGLIDRGYMIEGELHQEQAVSRQASGCCGDMTACFKQLICPLLKRSASMNFGLFRSNVFQQRISRLSLKKRSWLVCISLNLSGTCERSLRCHNNQTRFRLSESESQDSSSLSVQSPSSTLGLVASPDNAGTLKKVITRIIS